MAPMPKIDDRLLWLGFGIVFFLTAKGIQYAIQDIVRLIEIDTLPEPGNEEKDLPENNISLENLQILAESPNPSISNAAISLVLERFIRQPDAYRSIVRDINQQHDERLRARAKQALAFLRDSPVASSHPQINPQPWSPVRISHTTSPSLLALEDIRNIPEVDMHGLLDSPAGLGVLDMGTDIFVPSEDNPVAGWTNVPRERPIAEDVGEMERRRRRREAMVLRESEGGVEESDIIRPSVVR